MEQKITPKKHTNTENNLTAICAFKANKKALIRDNWIAIYTEI